MYYLGHNAQQNKSIIYKLVINNITLHIIFLNSNKMIGAKYIIVQVRIFLSAFV